MSKLDKDQVIAAFTEAYSATNGKAPAIEAKGGWYSVDGGKNMRLSDLDTMTAELSSSKSTKKKEAPEKPKEASKSKPATADKVAKTPKKSKTKAKSDFSVKAFWAESILEKNSGSKIPR